MEIGLLFHKHHKPEKKIETKYEFCVRTVYDTHSLYEKKMNKDHERILSHHIIYWVSIAVRLELPSGAVLVPYLFSATFSTTYTLCQIY